MEKRGLLLTIFLAIILLNSFLVSSAEINDSSETPIYITENSVDSKLSLAKDCIDDIVADKECDKLTLEEKIFAVLGNGRCKKELSEESRLKECWPQSGCDIESTAKAILAMDYSGSSTRDAEKWLLNQNTTAKNLIWYLQIIKDKDEEMLCTISYDGNSNTLTIDEENKLSSSAGSCLSLNSNKNWLIVSPSCYEKEFEIKCNQDFKTSLLYQRPNFPTIYPLGKTSSGVVDGTTTEKVEAYCFGKDGRCDYKASLWATYALNQVGKDMSDFVLYLDAFAEENSELLPEAFLFAITENSYLRESLLEKQQDSKYWDSSSGKLYGTALAFLGFANEEPPEKTNSKEWLFEIQNRETGCWGESLRDTSFLLYSLWREKKSASSDVSVDCEDEGYECLSSSACLSSGGIELSSYSGCGTGVCCETGSLPDPCIDQGFEICNSRNQYCDGNEIEIAELGLGKVCCDGLCIDEDQENICEIDNSGTCESSCGEGYERDYDYECTSSGEVCCVESSTSSETSIWTWILILLILAIIVIIFLFRDRLKVLLFKFKSRNDKSPLDTRNYPRSFPPAASKRFPSRAVPRKVIPSAPRSIMPRPLPPIRKQDDELAEVLDKLKKLGK